MIPRAIHIFVSYEQLSRAAAEHFVHRAEDACAARDRFLVAFSGGGTPQRFFELLATAEFASQVEWQRCFIFWVDERVVAPTEPGSNYGQVHDALLTRVPIPPKNIVRIKGELPAADAAAAYTTALDSFRNDDEPVVRFDVALLGMGEDGHTASLFPGSPYHPDERVAAIPVTASYQGRPAQRVTLTPFALNAARQITYLVSGAAKAEAVLQALRAETDPVNRPVQRIVPTDGEIFWYLDEGAAAKLTAG